MIFLNNITYISKTRALQKIFLIRKEPEFRVRMTTVDKQLKKSNEIFCDGALRSE